MMLRGKMGVPGEGTHVCRRTPHRYQQEARNLFRIWTCHVERMTRRLKLGDAINTHFLFSADQILTPHIGTCNATSPRSWKGPGHRVGCSYSWTLTFSSANELEEYQIISPANLPEHPSSTRSQGSSTMQKHWAYAPLLPPRFSGSCIFCKGTEGLRRGY
ncbi:hypothetical protein BD779DRAFT_239431 [Infundibulicybe gibba]|nr:hypothetical protein BD779DRAFT_239431 [Infundibulicybe gibba]